MGFEYLHNNIKLIDIVKIYELDKMFDLHKLTILEVGSGNGSISIPFSNYVREYTAIEKDQKLFTISNNLCKELKCKINFINSDIIGYNSTKKFDLIFLHNVIEFLPKGALKKLISMLSGKGKVIIFISKPVPKGWGDERLNKNSPIFDKYAWDCKKTKLGYWKYKLLYKYKAKLYDTEGKRHLIFVI